MKSNLRWKPVGLCFYIFLPASQLYLIFLATSRKKQHAELEKKIDEDMALNSDMISTTNETLMKIQAVMASPK